MLRKTALPQGNSLSVPVSAHHLPCLVSNLYVPIFVLLPVLSVTIPLLLNELPGLWIPDCFLLVFALLFFLFFVLPAFPRLPYVPCVGHRTATPWPHIQAVQAFFSRAQGQVANLKISQVRTGRAPIPGWSNNLAKPIGQPFATALGTLRPGRELRDNAVLSARNEASLF